VKQRFILLLGGMASLALCMSAMQAATYTTITYPQAISTSANGLNDSDQIVGSYVDVNNNYHAFLYDQGAYTNIDPANSNFAIANGINDAGVIVGGYSVPGQENGIERGFISQEGKVQAVDYPDAQREGTALTGLNNKDAMVGIYWFRNSQNQTVTYGFIFSAGKFQQLHKPGSDNTLPLGINDAGEVTGWYSDANGNLYGFVYKNGTYYQVNYPDASGSTTPAGINDASAVVGSYLQSGFSHGFEFFDGSYSTIDYPGGPYAIDGLSGINKNSHMVGNYGSSSPNSASTGFLRVP
jgi:probable HAF family extracellular repeat protein